MPVRRSRSRDGTVDPIRRTFSEDPTESSLREPLLLAESGASPKNMTPSHYRQTVGGNGMMMGASNGSAASCSNTTTTTKNNNSMIIGDSTSSPHHHLSPCNSNTSSAISNHNHHHHHNNTSSSSTTNKKLCSVFRQIVTSARHNPDSTSIGAALIAWYLVGVLAICTTKLLLSTPLEEGGVPSPLVLTLQQMTLGSLFLRTFCIGRVTSSPGHKKRKQQQQ